MGVIRFRAQLQPRGPAAPDVAAAFEAMAFTHRKEYARWIAEAKQEQTRQRRVQQALDMIRSAKTRS
jgi:uncharacterized protein YdeI (YjbR/CyaY-like superfamily)